MGKKDVIMDNGKKAQGAMARYWKKQKEYQNQKKHNRNKNQDKDRLDQQDNTNNNNNTSLSSYDQWKNHQADLLLGKYKAKPNKNQQINQQQQLNNEKNQKQKKQESYDSLMKKVDKKQQLLNLPGYGLTYVSLQRSLTPINVESSAKLNKQKNRNEQQSKRSLIKEVPKQLNGLFESGEDLARILRLNKEKKRKNKQQFSEMRRQDYNKDNIKLDELRKQKSEHIQGKKLDPLQRTLQQQNYDARNKIEKTQQQILTVKQQKIFKSDILNKLAKGNNLVELLQKNTHTQQTPKSQQIINNPPIQSSQQQAFNKQQSLGTALHMIPRSVLLRQQQNKLKFS